MFSTRSIAFSLIFGGAFAFGASISLSSECQATLLTIAESSDATCLDIAGLAGLLTTSDNSSLVPSVDSWLSGFCSADPCTNSSLASVAQNISSGCSSDLSSFGLSNSSSTSDDITQTIEAAYPLIRDIGCLKVESNNTFCVTDLLDDIESVEGTLSLENLFEIVPELLTGQLTSLPSYITCNDCVAQAFSVLKTNQPTLANTTVENALTSQCGSDFLSSSATGITEGTGTAAADAASSSTSGALTASAFLSKDVLFGLTFSSLIAVLSGFLVLA